VTEEKKFRVLVVDDEGSVLITYRLILEQQGYVVTACSTSLDAIRAIEKQSFDVVLCDYSLEEQHTGFEVIAAARKRAPDVPAALLTGYATKETADEADSRKIGIMFKPIEIEEFLATTSRMLRRNDESNNEKGAGEKESGPQDGAPKVSAEQRGVSGARRPSANRASKN
jgi:DNA-binding NtrC family response regulator